eukprot:c49382_g1_i1 orf=57-266(+)
MEKCWQLQGGTVSTKTDTAFNITTKEDKRNQNELWQTKRNFFHVLHTFDYKGRMHMIPKTDKPQLQKVC